MPEHPIQSNQGRRIHPGSGRRKTVPHPKGRQLDPEAVAQVRALLADRPRRRDMLIEYLHLIQDAHRCLSAAHLAALAQELRLAQAEVYEVASFYAHFDIVMEGEPPPPPVTVRVCDSLSCELMGAPALLAKLPEALGERVRVVRAPCMGRCDTAPVVAVGHRPVDHAGVDAVLRAVADGAGKPTGPDPTSLDDYRADGGYRLLDDCRSGRRAVAELIEILESSGLRGLGGAGFPAGRKWRFVRAEPRPRLLAVNADEGEPGTFKDRWFLERDPHRFLEGTLIAAWAIEAGDVYIYLRDEYPAIRELLQHEIARLDEAGISDGTTLHLRRGAGAYLCGE